MNRPSKSYRASGFAAVLLKPEDRDADGLGPGLKFDTGKLRWDLLPLIAVQAIVKVLSFGAVKYGPDNWQKLEGARDRYFAALMRHLVAYRLGESIDPESGEHHLAHAGCCLVFLLSIELGFDPKAAT